LWQYLLEALTSRLHNTQVNIFNISSYQAQVIPNFDSDSDSEEEEDATLEQFPQYHQGSSADAMSEAERSQEQEEAEAEGERGSFQTHVRALLPRARRMREERARPDM
jgi:hypothetical protein